MRAHLCLLSILVLLVVELLAADLTDFPPCAIACDEENLSNCSLSTNTTCFCASDSRLTTFLDTVESKCTVEEFFTTKRLYEKECEVTPLKRPAVVNSATLIPFILCTVFFIGRIFSKTNGLAGGWGLDDYTIIVAWVLGTAIYFLDMQMIRYGFGANIWDIVPQDDITMIYKLFQGLAVMYKVQISLAKISVILFLLRIFQTPEFRYMSYFVEILSETFSLTIIAIIRVVVFWNNRWGLNQTKGLYPLIYWSVIECQISVMCACLPASRALLGYYFPGFMGGESQRQYASGPDYCNTNGYARQDSRINISVSYNVHYGEASEHFNGNSDIELVTTDGKVHHR